MSQDSSSVTQLRKLLPPRNTATPTALMVGILGAFVSSVISRHFDPAITFFICFTAPLAFIATILRMRTNDGCKTRPETMRKEETLAIVIGFVVGTIVSVYTITNFSRPLWEMLGVMGGLYVVYLHSVWIRHYGIADRIGRMIALARTQNNSALADELTRAREIFLGRAGVRANWIWKLCSEAIERDRSPAVAAPTE